MIRLALLVFKPLPIFTENVKGILLYRYTNYRGY